MNRIKLIFSISIIIFSLSSCTTGTPELSGLSPEAQAEIIKNYGGVYKVGKPYKIAGKWYYPKEDYQYSEVGIASWYGEDFNGKLTANGERYNMNTLTAAHRTLPLPSIVKVTNLQNGRSIILRVNDRGPYVKNRIIDLSKRGAQLLGYLGQGTTKVKVEVLANESKALKAAMHNQPYTQTKDIAFNNTPAKSLYASNQERIEASKNAEIYGSAGGKHYSIGMYHPVEGEYKPAVYGSAITSDGLSKTASLGKITEEYIEPDTGIYGKAASKINATSKNGTYYVQAGAFSRYDLAHRLMVRLKEYGSSKIDNANVKGKQIYRVSVGPYSREEEAKVAQAKLKYYGIKDARIEKK